MPTKPFVVVTTEHRGVFAGVLAARDDAARTVRLTDAQMAVYWSTDVQGVLGLAASGPTKRCRISPAVPAVDLRGVTAVMEATSEAQAAWKGRPWG